jgi:hypothetical protein
MTLSTRPNLQADMSSPSCIVYDIPVPALPQHNEAKSRSHLIFSLQTHCAAMASILHLYVWIRYSRVSDLVLHARLLHLLRWGLMGSDNTAISSAVKLKDSLVPMRLMLL